MKNGGLVKCVKVLKATTYLFNTNTKSLLNETYSLFDNEYNCCAQCENRYRRGNLGLNQNSSGQYGF